MPRTPYGTYETLNVTQGATGRASFKFSRDSPTATVPGSRIITLPKGSTYNTGLHWHEDYTENVKVLQGEVILTLCKREAKVEECSCL